jgi:predicted small lipoprotein YifL
MTRIEIGRLALVLCLSATMLAGCGRKGDLDAPGNATLSKEDSKAKNKNKQGEDTPFLLDPLL